MKSTSLKFHFDHLPYNFLRYLDRLPDGFRANDPYCLLDAIVIAVGFDNHQKPCEAFYLNSKQLDGWIQHGKSLHGGELVTASSVTIPQIGQTPCLQRYIVPCQSINESCNRLPIPRKAICSTTFMSRRTGAHATAHAVAKRHRDEATTYQVCAPPTELRWAFKWLAKLWRRITRAN